MTAHPLLLLPSWDARPTQREPHGRACVRLTAFVASARGLRAVTVEALTEADAVGLLNARGVRW